MGSRKDTTTVSPTRPADKKIYQLRISLKDADTIWRRVLVKADTPLGTLHDIIQAAMGWGNYHMHSFTIGRKQYGEPSPDLELDFEDEALFTLGEILPRARQKMEYEYDFGDSWLHTIVVEKVLAGEDGMRYPVCIAGERACPPEDCGGIGGYEELLGVIAVKNHPEHDEMLEWVGGSFDPEAFAIERANDRLEPLQPKVPRLRTRKRGSPAAKQKKPKK